MMMMMIVNQVMMTVTLPQEEVHDVDNEKVCQMTIMTMKRILKMIQTHHLLHPIQQQNRKRMSQKLMNHLLQNLVNQVKVESQMKMMTMNLRRDLCRALEQLHLKNQNQRQNPLQHQHHLLKKLLHNMPLLNKPHLNMPLLNKPHLNMPLHNKPHLNMPLHNKLLRHLELLWLCPKDDLFLNQVTLTVVPQI
jgi:hypothetical protein